MPNSDDEKRVQQEYATKHEEQLDQLWPDKFHPIPLVPDPRKLTYFKLRTLLGCIQYLDWKWRLMQKGDGFLVQVVFMAPDSDAPHAVKEHHGRKWYISSHSTVSEVVMAAWAAVERVVLHEARENFYYRGRRILDPHVDVEALVDLADCKRLDVRK